jgi:VHS domain
MTTASLYTTTTQSHSALATPALSTMPSQSLITSNHKSLVTVQVLAPTDVLPIPNFPVTSSFQFIDNFRQLEELKLDRRRPPRRQKSLISPKPGPRCKQSDKCTTHTAYTPVTNRDVPRSKKARRTDNPVGHKPYSSISVAIEIMTDEMHQINYLDGLDELIKAINFQTDGPREAARAIRKKLQYGSVHCQLHTLCILEALVEEAGPKFRSSFLDKRLWKRLRFCARADLSSPRVKEKCRVIFRLWNIKYSSTPGLAALCSLYHVSCFNRNEVVEALTCCCSKSLVLMVLLKQRSEAGAVVSQKLLFNFWLRGCQH